MRTLLSPLLLRGWGWGSCALRAARGSRGSREPARRGRPVLAAPGSQPGHIGYATKQTTDTCCREPCPPSFSVVPCSCCDEDRVMDFMTRTFYREEPVLVAAGLTQSIPQVLLDHTRSSFREGLSLMAVLPEQQDRICGVAINSIVSPGDACKLRQQAEETSCCMTRRVLELWALMLEQPEIWRDPDQSCQGQDLGCMMELRELATDETVRGRGVGLQLALAAREVAADVGSPAFKIDCTSRYSAQIAGKLGMRKVFSLRYADFVDAAGQPFFQPACPHEEAAVYTQRLSKDCQHKFGGEF